MPGLEQLFSMFPLRGDNLRDWVALHRVTDGWLKKLAQLFCSELRCGRFPAASCSRDRDCVRVHLRRLHPLGLLSVALVVSGDSFADVLNRRISWYTAAGTHRSHVTIRSSVQRKHITADPCGGWVNDVQRRDSGDRCIEGISTLTENFDPTSAASG